MKRINLLIIFSLFWIMTHPVSSGAEEFLGAPVIPGGKTNLKTESRLEMVSPLSHDEILKFYKDVLKGEKDIKFRDWKDATYIEDDGNLLWHSITISKPYKDGTTIVIVKDNWTWIIGTLILRFVGVFVVLIILFLSMSLSGSLISRCVKKMEEKDQ